MAEEATKADEKGCCGTGKKCCGGKALAALALLLVGGVGGYLAGRHCKSCAVPPAAEAPAQPAK